MNEKKVVQFSKLEELEAIQAGLTMAIDWLENFQQDVATMTKAGLLKPKDGYSGSLPFRLQDFKGMHVRLAQVIKEWQGDL